MLSEDEHKTLQETLRFVKEDAEAIEKTPCVWSEIHSFKELMRGLTNINRETKEATVQWDSRLGLAIRKNKFA